MNPSVFLISFHLFKNVLFSLGTGIRKGRLPQCVFCFFSFVIFPAFKLNRKAHSHSTLIAFLNFSDTAADQLFTSSCKFIQFWCFPGAFFKICIIDNLFNNIHRYILNKSNTMTNQFLCNTFIHLLLIGCMANALQIRSSQPFCFYGRCDHRCWY